MTKLQIVVELDTFLKRAKAIMSDEERMGIVLYLAANPEAGTPLGGGLRSLNDQTHSVIASEARQSSICAWDAGLLRFARNDDRICRALNRRI
jgi:dsDNA-binding SOS-regulon protein